MQSGGWSLLNAAIMATSHVLVLLILCKMTWMKQPPVYNGQLGAMATIISRVFFSFFVYLFSIPYDSLKIPSRSNCYYMYVIFFFRQLSFHQDKIQVLNQPGIYLCDFTQKLTGKIRRVLPPKHVDQEGEDS